MLFSMPGYDRMLCTAALLLAAIVFLPFDGITHSCVNKKVNLTHLFFFLFFFQTKNIQTVSPTALNGQTRVEVKVGEGEPIETALRRFKREVNKSGHLMDLRHKRYFENSQDRKKRKIVQARIRKRLERMQARRLRQRAS